MVYLLTSTKNKGRYTIFPWFQCKYEMYYPPLGPRSLPIRLMSPAGQSVHHSSQRRPPLRDPIETKKRRIGLLGKLSEWVKVIGISYVEHVEHPDPPKKIWCFFWVDFFGMSFCFLFVFFCNLALELDMMDFFVRQKWV